MWQALRFCYIQSILMGYLNVRQFQFYTRVPLQSRNSPAAYWPVLGSIHRGRDCDMKFDQIPVPQASPLPQPIQRVSPITSPHFLQSIPTMSSYPPAMGTTPNQELLKTWWWTHYSPKDGFACHSHKGWKYQIQFGTRYRYLFHLVERKW